MSIPKIIHYCWFGGNPLPEKVEEKIASWKRFCPDYEIIEWNESNYDCNKIQYISEAYKEKKWPFVSDYARLDIVYNNGGIYLDTDVELVKSLDELLEKEVFFALEKGNSYIATGLGFGGVAGNKHLLNQMKIYQSASFYKEDGSINLTACPVYTTEYFKKLGFEIKDETQNIDGALILSSEYFCPMSYVTGEVDITDNTFGIHWYDASWHSKHDRKILDTERKIRRTFPGFLSRPLCFVYRKGYRLIQYTTEGKP